jgi:hypothetical protein
MGRGEYRRTGSRHGHGRPRVGSGADDDFSALANLRTFRGKLNAAVERTADWDQRARDQLAVWVNEKPPSFGGTLGGDDLNLTPDNLGIVNWSLRLGGEVPITLEPQPRGEGNETVIGHTRENVGQLLARVTRAIERILARVHAQTAQNRGRSAGRASIVGAEAEGTQGSSAGLLMMLVVVGVPLVLASRSSR